jgi:hypothetical protein
MSLRALKGRSNPCANGGLLRHPLLLRLLLRFAQDKASLPGLARQGRQGGGSQ